MSITVMQLIGKVSIEGADVAFSNIERLNQASTSAQMRLTTLSTGSDTASQSLSGRLSSSLSSNIGRFLSFASSAGMAVFGLGQLINAAKNATMTLLGPAASAEQTQIAFKGLLGSGEKASAFLTQLRQFAAKTPFEFPELTGAARRMLAFGFSTKDVIPMMTTLGDAVNAMGGGSEEIDRAVYALGQMKAKTKVSAEEMNMFLEMGIPGWDYLAKAMNKSVAEVMDMSSKGLIPADKGIQAILKGMQQFKGGMEAQSKTFVGMMSNLKDSLNMALIAFTGPLLEEAKGALGALGNLVGNPAFEQFAGVAGKQVASTIDQIKVNAQNAADRFHHFMLSLDPTAVKTFTDNLAYMQAQFGYLFGTIEGMVKGPLARLQERLQSVNIDLSGGVSGALLVVAQGFRFAGDQAHYLAVALGSFNISGAMESFNDERVRLFSAAMQQATTISQAFVSAFNSPGMQYFISLMTDVFAAGLMLVSNTINTVAKPAMDLYQQALAYVGNIVETQVKPTFQRFLLLFQDQNVQAFGGVVMNLGTALMNAVGPAMQLYASISPLAILFSSNIDVVSLFKQIMMEAGLIMQTYVIPAIAGFTQWTRDMQPIVAPIITQILGIFGQLGGYMQQIFPIAMDIAIQVMGYLGETIRQVTPLVSQYLMPAISHLVDAVGPAVIAFLNWVNTSGVLKATFDVLKIALSFAIIAISGLIEGVALAIQAFTWFAERVSIGWGRLQTFYSFVTSIFGNIGQWFWDRFNEVKNSVINALSPMVPGVQNALNGIITSAQNIYNGVVDALTSPFQDALDNISGIVTQITGYISTISGDVKQALHDYGVPGFASGTNYAPGGMAVVGERGPELMYVPRGAQIIPNHQIAGTLGGGSPTIIVQVSPELTIDGYNVSRVLMPHFAHQLRYGAAIGGI